MKLAGVYDKEKHGTPRNWKLVRSKMLIASPASAIEVRVASAAAAAAAAHRDEKTRGDTQVAGPFIVSMKAPDLWLAFTALLDEAGDDDNDDYDESMRMTRPADEGLPDTVLLFLRAVSDYSMQLRRSVYDTRMRMLGDIATSSLARERRVRREKEEALRVERMDSLTRLLT